VLTEITDATDGVGFVFYDANCRFCVRWARWAQPRLAERRLRLLPLQTPGCGHKLGLTHPELMLEMQLLLPDGRRLGGADAMLEIGRHFWWAWPIRQLARLPVMMKLFRAGYRRIARHRGCANGACAISSVGGPLKLDTHKRRTIAFFDLP